MGQILASPRVPGGRPCDWQAGAMSRHSPVSEEPR